MYRLPKEELELELKLEIEWRTYLYHMQSQNKMLYPNTSIVLSKFLSDLRVFYGLTTTLCWFCAVQCVSIKKWSSFKLMFDIIISLNKRGIKRKVVAAVWRCPPGTWQRAGSGDQNSRYSGFANPGRIWNFEFAGNGKMKLALALLANQIPVTQA